MLYLLQSKVIWGWTGKGATLSSIWAEEFNNCCQLSFCRSAANIYLWINDWRIAAQGFWLHRAWRKTTSPHKTTTHLWEHINFSCSCVTSQFADVEFRESQKYIVQPVCALQRQKPKWGRLNSNFKEQYSPFYLPQTQMIKDSMQQED